ncbi:MAG: hypothetical protein CMM07_23455 [Rhodopirellula sp.]|nr:hypothetical protein [Rhodopirellula sp.]
MFSDTFVSRCFQFHVAFRPCSVQSRGSQGKSVADDFGAFVNACRSTCSNGDVARLRGARKTWSPAKFKGNLVAGHRAWSNR